MSTEVLRSSEIQGLLAHRFPFLLVDQIRVVEPGRRVVGRKLVSASEWWAHMPGPTGTQMPYGLVVEALAQTSGALVRDLAEGVAGAVAYFMGIDRVRLRRAARPGDILTLEITLRQWRRGICRARGVATVDGSVVATADLTTIVRASA